MVAEWHPFLSAEEPEPGVWTLTAQYDSEPYGRVEIRRTEKGVRYKAELYGQVIGWATTLRVALDQVHGRYLRTLGPGGAAKADWGEPLGRLR